MAFDLDGRLCESAYLMAIFNGLHAEKAAAHLLCMVWFGNGDALRMRERCNASGQRDVHAKNSGCENWRFGLHDRTRDEKHSTVQDLWWGTATIKMKLKCSISIHAARVFSSGSSLGFSPSCSSNFAK